MFERGPHVSFANCGLPYFVGGEIAEQDSLLVQTPDSLKARFNLDVRINTEVIRIDCPARRIRVRELETGCEYEETYDALILSTGASPLKPHIPGIECPNHFVVRDIPDVEKIMEWSKHCQGCRSVVVGGGYIGLEMAEQLHRHGFRGGSAAPGDDTPRPRNRCVLPHFSSPKLSGASSMPYGPPSGCSSSRIRSLIASRLVGALRRPIHQTPPNFNGAYAFRRTRRKARE